MSSHSSQQMPPPPYPYCIAEASGGPFQQAYEGIRVPPPPLLVRAQQVQPPAGTPPPFFPYSPSSASTTSTNRSIAASPAPTGTLPCPHPGCGKTYVSIESRQRHVTDAHNPSLQVATCVGDFGAVRGADGRFPCPVQPVLCARRFSHVSKAKEHARLCAKSLLPDQPSREHIAAASVGPQALATGARSMPAQAMSVGSRPAASDAHQVPEPSTSQRDVAPPPAVPSQVEMDEQDRSRLSMSTELVQKVKSLQTYFKAIAAVHDKLQVDHAALQIQHSGCKDDVLALTARLDAAHEANQTLIGERDKASTSAAAAEESLRELEETSLTSNRKLMLEREGAMQEGKSKAERIVVLEGELARERAGKAAAEERCTVLEQKMKADPVPIPVPTTLSSRLSPNPKLLQPGHTSTPTGHKRPASPNRLHPQHLPFKPGSSSRGLAPQPPAKRARTHSPAPRSERSALGLSGRPIYLPVVGQVDKRFGRGWPKKEDEREGWTAFWASQMFPTELDVDSKVCLACTLENPGETRPEVFARSTLKVRREAQAKHVEIKHPALWREIVVGVGPTSQRPGRSTHA